MMQLGFVLKSSDHDFTWEHGSSSFFLFFSNWRERIYNGNTRFKWFCLHRSLKIQEYAWYKVYWHVCYPLTLIYKHVCMDWYDEKKFSHLGMFVSYKTFKIYILCVLLCLFLPKTTSDQRKIFSVNWNTVILKEEGK